MDLSGMDADYALLATELRRSLEPHLNGISTASDAEIHAWRRHRRLINLYGTDLLIVLYFDSSAVYDDGHAIPNRQIGCHRGKS